MEKKWIDGQSCNNCGECCMRTPTIELISKNEWIKIFNYIRIDREGILRVCELNEINRYINRQYVEPDFKALSVDRGDLFRVFNNDKNPCPFLQFDREKAHYLCGIQKHKPEICKVWFCEPIKSGEGYGECVLYFGVNMEYPVCEECYRYKEEFGEAAEGPDCELGEGCIYFERRIRYFLKFMNASPEKAKSNGFKKKLIKILLKQIDVFKEKIESKAELNESEVEENLNRYVNLLEMIKYDD